MKPQDDVVKPDEGQSRSTGVLERNKRVQDRFDELMREGKHGHYETLFRVVREEIEREREACAKVCESRGPTLANSDLLAELIRMRSNK